MEADYAAARTLAVLLKMAHKGWRTLAPCLVAGASYNRQQDRTTFRITVRGNRVGCLVGNPRTVLELVLADRREFETTEMEGAGCVAAEES